MSTNKTVIAAASLVVLFSVASVSAAPHPQSPGADNSGHESIVDAAKGVHIDHENNDRELSSVI